MNAVMSDLVSEVQEILGTRWSERDGRVVPDGDNVRLGNDAVKIPGTVLYADLADSTNLVKGYKWWFAAEVYKAYLVCACRIIRSNGGEITAFDGDRVMAIYMGDGRDTAAARSALQINYAVVKIINPQIKQQYPSTPYVMKQTVGVDRSILYAAKTGIRGSNDLVWVGTSANYAAKLSSIGEGNYASYITAPVFNNMGHTAKYSAQWREMWENRRWTAQNDMSIYRSSWIMPPD